MYAEFVLSAVGSTGELSQYEVDSKAMRKVDIGQDLVIVGEASGASQGFIMNVGGRMLVKVN